MGTGIIVCGLNGAGKSTLGRALAEKLHYHFIDNEELYFPGKDPHNPYACPRTKEDVGKLLVREIQAHEHFVFASVKGDYGEEIYPFFQYAVLINVPRDLRLRRVRERSYQKFGSRMLPGGDLHEQEERFFALVGARAENTVEEWVRHLNCPVMEIDGTNAVEDNVKRIVEWIPLERQISADTVKSISTIM